MHTDNLSAWTHGHVFDTGNALAERSIWVVMWITALAMVVEITAGWWFNSMALLADGWHMSSHAFAKSADLHVIADAATSVLAVVALVGGRIYGWSWLDPVMGIVGAVLVAIWAKGLLVETGRVLLDREMDHPIVAEIREVVESGTEGGDTRITDLHVWRANERYI